MKVLGASTSLLLLLGREAIADRIAFASCNNADRDGLWGLMGRYEPNKLILLGDTMYSDRKVMKLNIPTFEAATPVEIQEQYEKISLNPHFRKLVESVGGWKNVAAVWDDHDFGVNNGDRTYAYRERSMDLFHNFINTPHDSPKRKQEGIYSSTTYTIPMKNGISKFTYKIVLLDVRYSKDPPHSSSKTKMPPPVDTSLDGDGDFLGEEQWAWLERELHDDSEPDLFIIGSGLQILPTDKIVQESWNDFPAARERLLQLVLKSNLPNVVLLSGDIHSAEVNRARCWPKEVAKESNEYSSSIEETTMDESTKSRGDGQRRATMLWELTSSGLTHTFTKHSCSQGDTLRRLKAEGVENAEEAALYPDIVNKGWFYQAAYDLVQATFPAHYREQRFADHYDNLHFALLDIVEAETSGLVENLVFRVISHQGQTVIQRSIPLKAHRKSPGSVASEVEAVGVAADGGDVRSLAADVAPSGDWVCEPYWGPVPLWRKAVFYLALLLTACVCLSVPVTIILIILAAFIYLLFWRKKGPTLQAINQTTGSSTSTLPTRASTPTTAVRSKAGNAQAAAGGKGGSSSTSNRLDKGSKHH